MREGSCEDAAAIRGTVGGREARALLSHTCNSCDTSLRKQLGPASTRVPIVDGNWQLAAHFKFVTAFDLNKCLQQVKLPSSLNSRVP